MAKLSEVARIIRSKNAGPFELTLDVMFDDRQVYEDIKGRAVLSAETIGRLYDRPVLSTYYFDNAMAFKATLPRTVSAGTTGDSDVFGAQQHAPLLDLEVS